MTSIGQAEVDVSSFLSAKVCEDSFQQQLLIHVQEIEKEANFGDDNCEDFNVALVGKRI